MDVGMIGKRIATMRKEKGIKQEELGKYVGVTAQAVSKWENGGVPDVELLPRLADFFGVSMDALFGRESTDYTYLQKGLEEKLIHMPEEERFRYAFEFCWSVERALFGEHLHSESIEAYEQAMDEKAQHYSSIVTDYGFTRMGVANRLQYFLLVPEIRNTELAFFNGVDYPAFFKDFSEKDIFDTCVMLNRRDANKAFTPRLLVKHVGVDHERAVQILGILEKYRLIYRTQLEMDEEIQTVYHFRPTPSFVALLIFAREVIRTPRCFSYQKNVRGKPHL